MIRFLITKPAQQSYLSNTGPKPEIAFSIPDNFLKIGVLDGLTPPSPLAQIRNLRFLIVTCTPVVPRIGSQIVPVITFQGSCDNWIKPLKPAF